METSPCKGAEGLVVKRSRPVNIIEMVVHIAIVTKVQLAKREYEEVPPLICW